eukprot:GFUD01025425.1.p1 GENE.GFUD01025425.1~~GFUD01025425.1.p1  ORF type:complete len:268 (+),score=78.05 GFUD01025425.1:67-870(+)
MQMKRLKMCGAMYHYYQTTRSNILNQTSSDTLSEALSEAMKKMSIKTKKQLRRKMERPRAASYSVEISREFKKERDEDEYSIIGVEDNHEVIDCKEMNNNVTVVHVHNKENEEYDSFKILRSMSLNAKSKANKEDSYDDFLEGIQESCDAVRSSSPCPPHDETLSLLDDVSPGASAPATLHSALQAFSHSTAMDRTKMRMKLPDPAQISVQVRDRFSLERRSMITLPMMTVSQIRARPRTAPDNSELEKEWRMMMKGQRRTKRQMSV